jgi:hypothetical protein
MHILAPITPGTHPVLKQRAIAILTPPLVTLEQTLSDCLQAGETSLCVYGAYRSGKTTAALYLKNAFAAQNILFLLLQMGEPEEESRKMPDFWARLRAANGNRRFYDEATSRETLINDLEVDADSRNGARQSSCPVERQS